MSFADLCQHCDHYHEKAGKCCFCEKLNAPDVQPRKSRDEHLAELEELGEGVEI